jgi:hypothetical protein
MARSARGKKQNKRRSASSNGGRRKKSRRKSTRPAVWKPPTGKALKKLQEEWDHVT